MMSDFGNYSNIKTRKEHECVYCRRTIPTGTSCFNYRGRWQGDWQNWYSCEFCEKHVDPVMNEPISGDEFMEWLTSSDNFKCHNCGEHTSSHEWEWARDDTTVVIECLKCEHQWVVDIPFEIN